MTRMAWHEWDDRLWSAIFLEMGIWRWWFFMYGWSSWSRFWVWFTFGVLGWIRQHWVSIPGLSMVVVFKKSWWEISKTCLSCQLNSGYNYTWGVKSRLTNYRISTLICLVYFWPMYFNNGICTQESICWTDLKNGPCLRSDHILDRCRLKPWE